MIQKIIYLIIATIVGFIFYQINIPAGWLLGSLITGMICGIFIKRYIFTQNSFRITLAFVSANISLTLTLSTLQKIHTLILPLFITIIITIVASFFFGIFLFKKTKGIDKITAFFCCIPGGASEVNGISGQYGADDRLVAAFHTVRMTFFTLSIPLIVAYLHPNMEQSNVSTIPLNSINISTILFFVFVVILTLLLNKYINFPGGTLVFSIVIGFLLSEFIMEIDQIPRVVAGIGQALIGAFVGIRFDEEVLKKLWQAGSVTIMIIAMFFGLTLCNSYLFKLITEIPYATSLISTVPAGAAEMSVVAVALSVNPTIVATLHIIRVVILFLSLPILLKVFFYLNKEYDLKKTS